MTDDYDDKQIMATAVYVKDRIRRHAQATGNITAVDVKQKRGPMVGTLNKYLGGDNMRKIVLAWLFAGDFEILSPMSSKALTDDQVGALIGWIGWWRDEDMVWHTTESFPHESLCVLNAALAAYNQASRVQKTYTEADPFSLVANLVDMGGVVTAVTDSKDVSPSASESNSSVDAEILSGDKAYDESNLSKVDKKQDKGGQDNG